MTPRQLMGLVGFAALLGAATLAVASHPAIYTTADACMKLTTQMDVTTCQACAGGGSQYIAGAGCCTELNRRSTLTKGCVLQTKQQCQKIPSAQAMNNCGACLKAGKTFTYGYGCAP